MASSPKRFSIALSFPGECRAFVEDVALQLAQHVGRDRVLYDRFYEAEFARPDLDTYLQNRLISQRCFQRRMPRLSRELGIHLT
jgi:hypothetical protein